MTSHSKINEPPSVDEVLSMLTEILGDTAEEQWTAAEEELKYQGFNVVEFRKMIFSVKADKKEVTKDVTSMLRLFLIRGSKLSKIQKKTDKKAWTKYNTLDHIQGKGNSSILRRRWNNCDLGKAF